VTLVPPTEVAPAPPAISAGELLERARRDVGKIDRELRGGTPPVAAVRPDTAQARFERAMAGAWKDRSQTMVVDRYMSADGVVVERVSRGGDARCHMSGTVNFVPGILHDGSRPQTVSCPPAGSGWTRK
jgi:hypothetical protein